MSVSESLDSSRAMSVSPRLFFSTLLCALVIFLLGSWCATGTLAPYAATHHKALLLPECGYLANLDEYHFRGPFLMLDGAPAEQWNQSQVLRRILYPALSYPLMKLLGFHVGGILSSVLLHLGAFFFFLRFVRRRFGGSACLKAACLLSTYPGIAYWIGLPYSYALIVPGSLLSFLMLARLEERSSWLNAFCCGAVLGTIFTGYDLFTIYGAAGVLLCLYRRRFLQVIPFLVGIALPMMLALYVLTNVYGASLTNANSEIFATVLKAYTSVPDFAAWWPLLKAVPQAALSSFFHSNFVVLPLAFLILLIARGKEALRALEPWEWAVLLGGFVFFLFNNLAPPYVSNWQMRGDWLARLYQPVFPVFVVFLSRFSLTRVESRASSLFLAAVVLANFSVVFGPLVGSPVSDYAYHHFYRHAFDNFRMSQNIERYGARPLGFCRRIKPES